MLRLRALRRACAKMTLLRVGPSSGLAEGPFSNPAHLRGHPSFPPSLPPLFSFYSSMSLKIGIDLYNCHYSQDID